MAVRNIRREANTGIEKMEKNGEISEDDSERGKKEVQELTDDFVHEIDKLTEKKVGEVMAF